MGSGDASALVSCVMEELSGSVVLYLARDESLLKELAERIDGSELAVWDPKELSGLEVSSMEFVDRSALVAMRELSEELRMIVLPLSRSLSLLLLLLLSACRDQRSTSISVRCGSVIKSLSLVRRSIELVNHVTSIRQGITINVYLNDEIYLS